MAVVLEEDHRLNFISKKQINNKGMKKKVVFSLVVLLSTLQLMATNLVIEHSSGAEVLQNIAVIGKWVFVGNELQLLDKAGNVLATEAIENVKKIVFAESYTSVDDVEKADIVVYPNPTHDMLYINGMDIQSIRIYDLQGRVVLTTKGKELSVGELPVGTYLLQIGTQVVRFIKQ